MAERTCTMPGCEKPHRARGLCATHYNQQHQPNRHPRLLVECVICGVGILRYRKRDRRPTCSVDCRTILTYGEINGSGYDWAACAASRARRAGVRVVETFDRAEVFERDAWTCYLCQARLDLSVSPFDPSYPTVDHVVPLSKGGEHSLANVRTCCLACNSAKGDAAHAA